MHIWEIRVQYPAFSPKKKSSSSLYELIDSISSFYINLLAAVGLQKAISMGDKFSNKSQDLGWGAKNFMEKVIV